MAGYSERTGRARSTYRKALLSVATTSFGTGAPFKQGFTQFNETRELIKVKHIRGQLAIKLPNPSDLMAGWYGWVRWPHEATLSNSELLLDDSRFFGVKPFAIAGNLERTFPVELMGVNITPADQVQFVVVPFAGNVASGADLAMGCLCDIELQQFN